MAKKAEQAGERPGAAGTVQVIRLTGWEQKISALVRARQSGLFVQSLEESRALDALLTVTQWLYVNGCGRRLVTFWSQVQTQRFDPVDLEATPQGEHAEFFETLTKFVQTPITNEAQGGVLVLCDIEPVIDPKQHPENLRLLREVLRDCRGKVKTLVLLGKAFDLPAEIASDIVVVPFKLPTVPELLETGTVVINQYKANPKFSKVAFDETVMPAFARACAGLTEHEALGLLGLTVVQHEAFDGRAVDMALQEKAQIVRRSNVLEYVTPRGGMDQVGGLEHVKAWIGEQDVVLRDSENARAYGLEMPKGTLLLGVPGTGKSLMAEMLAAHWKLPLLKLDVGRVFGSLVGQSEANLRLVFDMCEAIAPCCVFLDEIEKAIGGKGGDHDGGTSTRVKGSLMSWLQSKPEGIFVIGAGNDISMFDSEPALIRAGRFDAVWFVDLPDMRARKEILGIHFKKRGHEVDGAVLDAAAKASRGYSGAELEVAVKTALRVAYQANPRPLHPTGEMLTEAVRKIVPLSKTMSTQIEALRRWQQSGKMLAAGNTLEDDDAAEKKAGAGWLSLDLVKK